jgi:hypothetical protein
MEGQGGLLLMVGILLGIGLTSLWSRATRRR